MMGWKHTARNSEWEIKPSAILRRGTAWFFPVANVSIPGQRGISRVKLSGDRQETRGKAIALARRILKDPAEIHRIKDSLLPPKTQGDR